MRDNDIKQTRKAQRYRTAHPEQIKAYSVRYSPVNRANHRKWAYGVAAPEYEKMLAAQDGRCAVCGADNSGSVNKDGTFRSMFVDHDHATGKVRGLLCRSCNSALGYAHDNPEVLMKLAEYLNRGGEPVTINV